jgi:lipoyl(octanoyl) transferase
VPCGISEYPVTSLAALGINATLSDFDAALLSTFPDFLNSLAKPDENCTDAPS